MDDIRRRIGELASQIGDVVDQQREQERGKVAAAGDSRPDSPTCEDDPHEEYGAIRRGQLHRRVSMMADQLEEDALTSDVANLRHEVSSLTQQLTDLMEQQELMSAGRRQSNAGSLGGTSPEELAQLRDQTAHMSDQLGSANSEELAKLKTDVDRLSEQLGRLAGSVDGAATRLDAHDASLESIMAQLQGLQSRCETAEREAKAGLTPEDLERLRASQRDFQNSHEESLQGLRSEIGKELNNRLKAFSDREAAQASRHKTEVAQLRAELEVFIGLDSAITARCLSCFDRRMQLKTESVTGSDGKVYTHNRPSPVPTETRLPRVKLRGAHIAARPDMPGVPGVNRFSLMADVQVEGSHIGEREMGRSASAGALERDRLSPLSDTVHSR